MKSPRVVMALTVANLALLLLILTLQLGPAIAQGGVPVLRGRALEIVDDQGRVRASIGVLRPADLRVVTHIRRACCFA